MEHQRERDIHEAHLGQMKNVYKILVGKPETKRPLGRPRCIWKNNIKIDVKEIECGLDSTGSVCSPVAALVNTVMNVRVQEIS
jgi:hypothetical protein